MAWFSGKFTLISSLPILEELVSTLKSFKIPLEIEDIQWWESLIVSKSGMVSPKVAVSIVKKDPDDNKFIEAAIEGQAEFIVSQDRHLLDIKEYRTIQIVSPKEFLEVIG